MKFVFLFLVGICFSTKAFSADSQTEKNLNELKLMCHISVYSIWGDMDVVGPRSRSSLYFRNKRGSFELSYKDGDRLFRVFSSSEDEALYLFLSYTPKKGKKWEGIIGTIDLKPFLDRKIGDYYGGNPDSSSEKFQGAEIVCAKISEAYLGH